MHMNQVGKRGQLQLNKYLGRISKFWGSVNLLFECPIPEHILGYTT